MKAIKVFHFSFSFAFVANVECVHMRIVLVNRCGKKFRNRFKRIYDAIMEILEPFRRFYAFVDKLRRGMRSSALFNFID